MRHVRVASLASLVFACVACRDDLDLSARPSLPHPEWRDPELTPTPTPPPTPAFGFGDGHDGPLIVAADTVVNTCHRVLSATASSVVLDDATDVSTGSLAVVVQMQDDFATSGDASPIEAPGDAGLWEIRRVSSVGGTTAVLASDLTVAFHDGAGETAQLCVMREYTDVTVNGGRKIRPTAWDGSSGGIVAFAVNGTLELVNGDSAVDANGRGFRGGAPGANGNGEDLTSDDTLAGDGGGKGEGLDGDSFGLFGRGNYANAGGGGNARNAGGGGGGGASGSGGDGGKQIATAGDVAETAGRAGARVSLLLPERITSGGGGGAGQADESNGGTGGTGGGIVLVFAQTISGPGRVSANGGGGMDVTADGAGGGGGGGTVILWTASAGSFTGKIETKGGRGGMILATDGVRRGPGGGGGGGGIWAPGVPGEKKDEGGERGLNANVATDAEWGAEDGQPE